MELRALHHHAIVLVLPCMCQQGTLVEEHHRLCAVCTSYFNVNTSSAVMIRKTPLHPEGIPALEAAVSTWWKVDIALWRGGQVGHIRRHGVGVVQQSA